MDSNTLFTVIRAVLLDSSLTEKSLTGITRQRKDTWSLRLRPCARQQDH